MDIIKNNIFLFFQEHCALNPNILLAKMTLHMCLYNFLENYNNFSE